MQKHITMKGSVLTRTADSPWDGAAPELFQKLKAPHRHTIGMTCKLYTTAHQPLGRPIVVGTAEVKQVLNR